MPWTEIKIESMEQIQDKDPDLYVKRAEKLLASNNIADALNEIDTAIRFSDGKLHYIKQKIRILDSTNFSGACRALIEDHLNRFYNDSSITEFMDILKLHRKHFSSKDSCSYMSYGGGMLERRNIPAVLIKLIDATSLNADGLVAKARESMDRGDYGEAIQLCDLAIKLNTRHCDAHFVKGCCYRKLNKNSLAEEEYRILLEIDHEHDAAYNNLANIIADSDKNAALSYYSRAIELAPDTPLYYKNKGNLLAKMSREKEALDCYENAIRYDRDNSELYLAKARMLRKLGHELQARMAENKAEKLLSKKSHSK